VPFDASEELTMTGSFKEVLLPPETPRVVSS